VGKGANLTVSVGTDEDVEEMDSSVLASESSEDCEF